VDKILSARLNESVIQRIGSLARRLHASKKSIIENAVNNYADQIDREHQFDVFEQTCGAWRRKEPAGRIIEEARTAFRKSMERRRK
jgi:predicted transcriptional regulator